MAIQTKQDFGVTSDAAGNKATLSYSYDDVSLLITQIVIVNNSPTMSAFASGTSTLTGKNYSTTVSAAQSPQTITIPPGQANRLQLKVDADNPNRLDGVEWEFRLV